MEPPALTYRIVRSAQLRYLPAFPSARIVLSGLDHLSDCRDASLVLQKGIHNHGLIVVNLDQVDDGREIDYCLHAMEQSLEALALDEGELETLEIFTDRFSAERSVGDEESFHAVVTAVHSVVRAARSPCVEDDEAVGALPHVAKGAFTLARAVRTFFMVVRAARSPSDAVAELARATRSPSDAVAELARAEVDMAGLVRAALGEVRAARARPVVLAVDYQHQLQVASADVVVEILHTTPPRTHGIWSTVPVLDVHGVAPLSAAGDIYYNLERCCRVGWRVPQLKKVGQARSLDAHLILLNYKVKLLFGRNLVREDGSINTSMVKTIGEQGKALVLLCTEGIHMFQSEVATLPDVLSVIVTATEASKVREMANRALIIIRSIRAQRILF